MRYNMSIATAIQSAQTKVASAYTSCNNKGATMPASADQNLSHLSATIDSIPTPTPINQAIQTWVMNEDNGVVTYSRNQVVGIGNYTMISDTQFQNDTTLVAALLPDTVYRLNGHSFSGCTNLKYVNLENITTIQGDETFRNSGLMGELYMPNIAPNYQGTWGSSVFQNTKITKVTSLGTLVRIEGNAGQSRGVFKDCTELESVALPSTARSLACTFWGCEKLTTVTGLENITSLGQWTFRNCRNLHIDELYLPNLTTISDAAFGGGGRDNFPYIYKITSLGNITTIPNGNPASNYGCFSQFKSLIEVTLHEGITLIGASAFQDCTSLPSITLPSTVTSIQQWAFKNCSSLSTLTCLATTPPTYNSVSLPSTITAIYVPSGSVSAYQSASGWSSFAAKIQAIP